MARAGFTLAAVQRMRRWASSTVQAYVEEAMEELPDVGQAAEVSGAGVSLRAASEAVFRAIGGIEARVESLEQIRGAEAQLALVDPLADAREWVEELREELKPSCVVHLGSRVVHAVRARTGPPSSWTTLRGWAWGCHPQASPHWAGAEVPAGMTFCARCSANVCRPSGHRRFDAV